MGKSMKKKKELYGKSPAMAVLPALKKYNKAKKKELEKLASPVGAFKVRIDQLENSFDDIVKDLKERKLTKAEYDEIENYLFVLAQAMFDEAQQL